MQLNQLHDDIFIILAREYNIDLRVLRLVEKGLGINRLSGKCIGKGNNVVARIIHGIRWKHANLVAWYYEQTGKQVTLADLEKENDRFVGMYYNHIPLYILQDHPELGVNFEFLCRYIRILGLGNYIKLAISQPSPDFRAVKDKPFVYHNIACELVHNCRSPEQTYLTYLLMLGHWNVPYSIVGPFTSNADYQIMTPEQVHSLHFLVLCNKNIENMDSITRLYRMNKYEADVGLTFAEMFIKGSILSEQNFLKDMTIIYEKLTKAGLDMSMITPIYNNTVLWRINAIDAIST